MAKISHTKIKQPSFGEKRPKLTYTKISRFTVFMHCLIQTSSVVFVTAMFFKGTRLTEESLYRTSHTSFVLCDKSFGLSSFRGKEFLPIRKQELPLATMLFTRSRQNEDFFKDLTNIIPEVALQLGH
jgi:hypothetical protein